METLPSKVRRLINYHLPVLLSWFSAYLMDLVTQQQPEHHLVRFNDTFDFSGLIKLYDDYRADSKRGSGIDHSTEQLVRAIYIKYHYVYSYRHLIQQSRTIYWSDGSLAMVCTRIPLTIRLSMLLKVGFESTTPTLFIWN